MIRAEHLTKIYKEYAAVSDITFHVEKGQTMVLLGTSGCGKTTTLKMLNGLIQPTEGEIWLDGLNIKEQRPEVYRKQIGYVLQDYSLFPHYTVEQNIAVVPRLLNWDTDRIQHRTRELMQKFNLPPEQYSPLYPHQLSGGQQQRVGLARALAAEPMIVLMDEPFGALDPVTRASVRKEMKALDEFQNKTIVLVTHDVQEAFELGDKICLMDQGRIVQQGTAAELLFQPADPFVTGFFKEQQLLLELRSVTLNELYSWLPLLPETNATITGIDRKKSLWDAVEVLDRNPSRLKILSSNEKEFKYADFASLMSAFNAYKNHAI